MDCVFGLCFLGPCFCVVLLGCVFGLCLCAVFLGFFGGPCVWDMFLGCVFALCPHGSLDTEVAECML